jgi:hypothetical protein
MYGVIKSVKGNVRYLIQSWMVAMVVFGLSCSKNHPAPEGILTHDQMVAVMSELYVSEQKISTLGIKRDSLAQIFAFMKDRIFAKTGVTDSVFKKSLNYYMDRPLELELIYTSLVDSLNLREQRIPAVQPRR